MLFWKNLRVPFLALTCSAVFLVLGKSVFYPASDNRTVAPFTFPPSIPLPGWQPLATQPLTEQVGKNPKYIAGQRYQYAQEDLQLDIEMHYLVDTVGDIQDLVKTGDAQKSSIRQQAQTGFYTVFTDKDKAYLRSCINPKGPATVNDRQFKQNRNFYDIQSPRLLLWLIGQEKLKDERCLWANLSIPLKGSSPEAAYQHLEAVWFPWYQWWHTRFPEP